MIVQSFFSDHWPVADRTNILKGSWEMYVFYVIHDIVLLSTSLATQCAFKKASLLKNFSFYVLQQDTSIIACNRSGEVFWLRPRTSWRNILLLALSDTFSCGLSNSYGSWTPGHKVGRNNQGRGVHGQLLCVLACGTYPCPSCHRAGKQHHGHHQPSGSGASDGRKDLGGDSSVTDYIICTLCIAVDSEKQEIGLTLLNTVYLGTLHVIVLWSVRA